MASLPCTDYGSEIGIMPYNDFTFSRPVYTPSELYTKSIDNNINENDLFTELQELILDGTTEEDIYWSKWIINTALNILRDSDLNINNYNHTDVLLALLDLACKCSSNNNINICKYIKHYQDRDNVKKIKLHLMLTSKFYKHQERLHRLS